ncbi:hypothetical protein QQ020_26045 [Fulvivirgaceae bacterium BMA12]|uniref:Uncharacterized protein n=1 Tax=Agaribacillus aureus TaxID=3051825 RepID=A0ABT8LEB9_9BACT|nr:hypothetical protein [Fulvivirgaceae bacterium BMA12]
MFQLKIPIANEQELEAYRKAFMSLLSQIEVEKCDRSLIENLKSVYKFLGHLNNDSLVSSHPEPLPQGE